ncbi:SmpA/OmlA domain-containing protein [Candidatus Filomicrobium marinum]|uniref:SmpA/OmlA domain-containing protein n=2 Tax=Filomicrobium TaxID=119044 RepID=A0A0D6JGZ4_9HYPH|nr:MULTISPECIES: outer membrane protein assembly factor BamE [Filomicrobium]CFX47901.1 SmpA/OmlA domain-containing protein [Candidatus Filomicrobium marinum]CPR20483.1 SmpA/OmlA domain-containing protein [Candidatus Filomicrobium marinum]SDP15730.1 Beta-barrel assembly machine subunit BamE [Filomicrobium insigne]
MRIAGLIRQSSKGAVGIGSIRRVRRRTTGLLLTMALLGGCVALAGCSQQLLKHGQHFTEGDLQQIQTGMSKDQVRLTLGTPSTTTTATATGGETYYYISSTATQTAFFKPTETDRRVVAVYFNPLGSVDRLAHYGMKDGKVFDFISRTTPAPGGNDEGLLKQLFRNLGTKQIFGD